MMTASQKVTMVQTLLENDPEATASIISIYLDIAKDKMLHRLYPYDFNITEIPEEYGLLQCELAVRAFLRRGGEGEIRHNENGIDRNYANTNDEDLLAVLTPRAKVVGYTPTGE